MEFILIVVVFIWVFFSFWIGVWVFVKSDAPNFVRVFYAVMSVIGALLAGVAIFFAGCGIILHTMGF